MEYALGIDIGGRSAKLALVSATGEVHLRRQFSTRGLSAPADLIDRLGAAVGDILADAGKRAWPVAGIGVGLPAMVDPADGTLAFVTNLRLLDGYPLHDELAGRFGLPVVLDNDVNCAALGEYHFGAGRGAQRLLCAAIGTGVGAAMVIGGELLRFSYGGIGDPGHIIVDPAAAGRCTCGGRGCLESLVSAPAIEARARRAAGARPGLLADRLRTAGALDAADISRAAVQGDPTALAVLDETARWLGIAVASWCHVFSPQVVVIGGGVALAGDLLLAGVRRTVAEYGMPFLTRDVAIVAAHLTVDAGVVGAAGAILGRRARKTT